MVKRKGSSGNWLEALRQLTEIIKTEYPDGGSLPPVPEMSRRLQVAENTYLKALRTVCQHGLAHARQGRAGTTILPAIRRHIKIGVLYPGQRPLLPQLPLQHLFKFTIKERYPTQMLSGKSPDTVEDEILILNISALYVVNPPPTYFPCLQQLHARGFPVAIVEYYDYARIDQALTCGLPYFHIPQRLIAERVCDFADDHGFGPIMLLDSISSSLVESFRETCEARGRTFGDDNFLMFDHIQRSLAAQVAKNGTELIYAKCNEVHGEMICRELLKLPDHRRPALILPEELKTAVPLKAYPQIRVAGHFDFDSPIYRVACKCLVKALKNGTQVALEEDIDFTIRPA